jgi:hypothetical protein
LKRQIILLGRLGTVIVAIGLAMLLVSLIPTYSTTAFGGSEQVSSGTFQGIAPFANLSTPNATFYGGGEYFTNLTPQQELNVKLTCNGTIDAYLLKMDLNTLFQSLNSSSGNSNNATLLEDYLKANPEAVAWQGKVTEGTVDYTPTAIINATLIFSNPSQNTILLQEDGKILYHLAPANETRTIAFVAIPIGFILALPWLNDLRKHRNSSSEKTSHTNSKQPR